MHRNTKLRSTLPSTLQQNDNISALPLVTEFHFFGFEGLVPLPMENNSHGNEGDDECAPQGNSNRNSNGRILTESKVTRGSRRGAGVGGATTAKLLGGRVRGPKGARDVLNAAQTRETIHHRLALAAAGTRANWAISSKFKGGLSRHLGVSISTATPIMFNNSTTQNERRKGNLTWSKQPGSWWWHSRQGRSCQPQ